MTNHKHAELHFQKLGFSIVELVVVIVIIGVLATISAVAYTQIQKQSRDTKRSSDMTNFQNELEKFYDKNGEYPPGCPNSTCTNTMLTSNVSSSIHINSASTTANIKTVLPGVSNEFRDPKYPNQTPIAVAGSSVPKYFYFGGTVNYGSTTLTLAYNTPLPTCSVYSSLLAGQVGSYVVGYYSEETAKWVLNGGRNGKAMTISAGTADDGCVINK